MGERKEGSEGGRAATRVWVGRRRAKARRMTGKGTENARKAAAVWKTLVGCAWKKEKKEKGMEIAVSAKFNSCCCEVIFRRAKCVCGFFSACTLFL